MYGKIGNTVSREPIDSLLLATQNSERRLEKLSISNPLPFYIIM